MKLRVFFRITKWRERKNRFRRRLSGNKCVISQETTSSMLNRLFLFALLLAAVSCERALPPRADDPGVSRELASYRKANYRDVSYTLHFTIPLECTERVRGEAWIDLRLERPAFLVLDFRADSASVQRVTLNGEEVDYRFENEHIIIDHSRSVRGENWIGIEFVSDDQSLNRRDDFLYTLLVPERARTLFPCFDQPDLKARFSLSLEVPEAWTAVANGAEAGREQSAPGRKTVSFRQTEPIPTYLFSFVAGVFEQVSAERDGREIVLFHRETDPQKIAQCPAVLDQVFQSLEWLEDYTGIPYPFEKYDLIVIPGFQYGGMEHMGATLYADRSIFLEQNATMDNFLARAGLIAHETAHMWFGDLVTMAWFDEVWTKEVFATFFSSLIVRPIYPEVNHELNFIKGCFPAAYSEDRTAGSTPIRQPLGNLSDAGLIYSQIIYSKSPIVMDKLFRKLGPELFQQGIREYLKTYAYGNATWDELIGIFDRLSPEDLRAWSRAWVDEKGMPTLWATRQGKNLSVRSEDPWDRGLTWPQELTLWLIRDAGTDILTLESGSGALVSLPEDIRCVLPNADGRAYGYFPLDSLDAAWLLANLETLPDPTARLSALLTLNENLLNARIRPADFLNAMIRYLPLERERLLYTQALGYTTGCFGLFFGETPSPDLERALWSLATEQSERQRKIPAIQAYCSVARTPEALGKVYAFWQDEALAKRFLLGEGDLIGLSYNLSLRFPERAEQIRSEQRRRITNPDRRRQYDYISPAASASAQVRDSVFNSLLVAGNRRIEPWACSALSLLNHPLRGAEGVAHIRPGLEAMGEIQRTGDIFFPRRWAAALLGPHRSEAAAEEVDAFFAGHPDYPLLLGSKIRQHADHLYRLREMRARYGICNE